MSEKFEISGKLASNIYGMVFNQKEKQKGETFARTTKKLLKKLKGVIPETEVELYLDAVPPPKTETEKVAIDLEVRKLQKIDMKKMEEKGTVELEYGEYMQLKKVAENYEYDASLSLVLDEIFDFLEMLKERWKGKEEEKK